MRESKYNYRYIARLIIEAKTPIIVGCGNKTILTDAPVLKDVNGLPYIPGSSLAGVMRHALGVKKGDKLSFWGFQDRQNPEESHGSQIIFSDAKLCDAENKAVDGIRDVECDPFLRQYLNLPIRQHAKINHRGITSDGGKFDEEVVFKGSRFCFEIEVLSDNDNSLADFKNVLRQFRDSTFRIGGGTRKGFGQIEVVEPCLYREYRFSESKVDLDDYIGKSSYLAGNFKDAKTFDEKSGNDQWDEFTLKLTPQDFFLFGSGMPDAQTDMTPVREKIVSWSKTGKAYFEDETKIILMPATSIKGALSHRTAYYYNKNNSCFVDGSNGKIPTVANDNPTVRELFGFVDDATEKSVKGNVIFSDILQVENELDRKILNHVKIDRFTGGAIDSALFNETILYVKGNPTYQTTIWIRKSVSQESRKAFQMAINDLCKGLLPLGGGVNRGNGCFKCDDKDVPQIYTEG